MTPTGRKRASTSATKKRKAPRRPGGTRGNAKAPGGGTQRRKRR